MTSIMRRMSELGGSNIYTNHINIYFSTRMYQTDNGVDYYSPLNSAQVSSCIYHK